MDGRLWTRLYREIRRLGKHKPVSGQIGRPRVYGTDEVLSVWALFCSYVIPGLSTSGAWAVSPAAEITTASLSKRSLEGLIEFASMVLYQCREPVSSMIVFWGPNHFCNAINEERRKGPLLILSELYNISEPLVRSPCIPLPRPEQYFR